MFFPFNFKLKPAALMVGLLMLAVPSLAACSSSGNGGGGSTEATANGNAIELGVLVIDDVATTRQRYEPLIETLSQAVGQPVVLVPLTQASQFNEAQAGGVDFIISNPLASVQLRRDNNTEILATLSRVDLGTEFGGVVIVPPDSAVNRVADLRGKKGACVSLTTAAAGCLFQMYHLQQEGVNPYTGVASITEIPSQPEIVQGVANGTFDFGFVRTGQIEQMVEAGQLPSANAVKILEPAQDGYALPHTTRLYPTWAFSVTQAASADVVNKMQQALLNIPAGDEALASANIEQFVPPVDYSPVEEVIGAFNL